MLHQTNRPRQRREMLVISLLVLLFGAVVLLLLLLMGGAFLLSMLVALAVMAVIGWVHYLFWGEKLEGDRTFQRPREDSWARRMERPGPCPDHDPEGLVSPSANGYAPSIRRRQG